MNTSVTQLPGSTTDGQTLGLTQMHLGTVVEISGHGASHSIVSAGINAAFQEVARIHRLMSFHSEDSDVSKLNRSGAQGVVTVDPRTVAVLSAACEVSRLSDGIFDVTVAPQLVSTGHLPRPPSACAPSSDASWRDIEIVAEDTVVFHRPLWIDLGGIAKGFAVDQAFEVCLRQQLDDCLINAGGDIRISHGITGSVMLDVPSGDTNTSGCVELTGGSIASSCGWPNATLQNEELIGCHFNGATGSRVDPTRFVSVLAERCMVADALTKVVLVMGERALPVLSACSATAFAYEKCGGWEQIPPASVSYQD